MAEPTMIDDEIRSIAECEDCPLYREAEGNDATLALHRVMKAHADEHGHKVLFSRNLSYYIKG